MHSTDAPRPVPATGPSSELGALAVPARDLVEPRPAVHLRAFLRWLPPIALFFGFLDIAVGWRFDYLPNVGVGVSLVGYAIWVTLLSRVQHRLSAARIARHLAIACFTIMTLVAILQANLRDLVPVGALLPVALLLPFVDARGLRWLVALAWTVGVGAAVVSGILPSASPIPPTIAFVIKTAALAVVLGLVLYRLHTFSASLKEGAAQLADLAAMSAELARTRDPLRVGDLIARHLATAVGADQAGICYWDRERDAVLTYGYFPADRRDQVDDTYDLADYPETRTVLQSGVRSVVRDDDPNADAGEVAYLHSIGQRALAMLPLVANGRTLGLVELSSADPALFDARRLGYAEALAGEAALALENAVLHAELRQLAYHDPLTKLANRALFRERVEAALTASTGDPVTILFLDLDGLKAVNDRHGHGTGDALLIAVAARLQAILRPTDLAARLAGDEFAILLGDGASTDAGLIVGQRMVEAVGAQFEIGRHTVTTGASIGVASTTVPAASPLTHGASVRAVDQLLGSADRAMYAAKAAGKGRVMAAHLTAERPGAGIEARGAA